MRYSIIYGTTRQWNPGDEFILQGAINIFRAVLGEHNAIIYNRSPEVRDPQLRECKRRLGMPFLDNSLKPGTDCGFADLAVFAGSPEWCNAYCTELYAAIHRHRIPAVFIGLGSSGQHLTALMCAVLARARFISFRDPDLRLNDARLSSVPSLFRPCPALLCVPQGQEKSIGSVGRIGLVYAVDRRHGVVNNCVHERMAAWLDSLYAKIIRRFRGRFEFAVICHYIDELAPAQRRFGGVGGGVDILYDYDSRAYQELYGTCDLIISPRVHGCGMAASLGIPSVALVHDFRGGTAAASFLSRSVACGTPAESVFAIIEELSGQAAALNSQLLGHKHNVALAYAADLAGCTRPRRVDYDNPERWQLPDGT